MRSKYLVTPALPYANGPAHLGHLVEHVQVNVFVRALRMAGEDVLCVCGADSHGTPIELRAAEAGMSPADFTAKWQDAFERSFRRYGIEFDGGFGTTHTSENERHAGRIYEALKSGDHLERREIEQLYDPEAGRFLADRMVKGTCPSCSAADQYGDFCEVCGSTYRPTQLIDARSVVTGATPELRASEHIFVRLGAFAEPLRQWTQRPGVVNEDVQNYLGRWFEEGLKDWDISRDAPYHGFPIPGEQGKYFYVWLDAPIGYMSLTERAAALLGRTFEDYWCDSSTRIFHFIGKDITYFHTLFWPAMLMAAGHTLPEKVSVHGMLTVNGVKMSKSRGTFLLADDLADALGDNGVQALRYYFACKLTSRTEDIDLNLEDFTHRVNADLVNKVVNLLSRTVPMLHRNHEGKLGHLDVDASAMLEEARAIAATVESSYRQLDFAKVVKDVVAIADLGNRYLQDQKPWDTVKTDPARAHAQLTTALALGRTCVALLKPIVPAIAEMTERMLGLDAPGFTFANAFEAPAPGSPIGPYERLFERLDLSKVQALAPTAQGAEAPTSKPPTSAPASKPAVTTKAPTGPAQSKAAGSPESLTDECGIDDFMRVDLRVAEVISAADVDGADKLIRLELDAGPLGKRQVFSGLKPHVQPADLVGKRVVLVANLKPRKMKFGMSEGMILAAGEAPPRPVFVPDASPGDRIR
ncbi:MAG: methionine--tRNA ligase [Myxococcota bacterium]